MLSQNLLSSVTIKKHDSKGSCYNSDRSGIIRNRVFRYVFNPKLLKRGFVEQVFLLHIFPYLMIEVPFDLLKKGNQFDRRWQTFPPMPKRLYSKSINRFETDCGFLYGIFAIHTSVAEYVIKIG